MNYAIAPLSNYIGIQPEISKLRRFQRDHHGLLLYTHFVFLPSCPNPYVVRCVSNRQCRSVYRYGRALL